ncbi:MAG: DUF4399 domain-containing protein [Verrucomicrobiales bacterium]|nr:DUF4399 domain-containing protein [Verrucomicrobiales bacterium]
MKKLQLASGLIFPILKPTAIFSIACVGTLAMNSCSEAPEPSSDEHGSHSAATQFPPAKTSRPADAKLYIVSPADGAEVSSPFVVNFGLKGIGVAPAGIYIAEDMPTGHHHLLIDVEKLPDLTLPIAKDDTHIHFGGGQTETTLTLTPGKHTLQLVLGNQTHIPHDPPLTSKKITITVK